MTLVSAEIHIIIDYLEDETKSAKDLEEYVGQEPRRLAFFLPGREISSQIRMINGVRRYIKTAETSKATAAGYSLYAAKTARLERPAPNRVDFAKIYTELIIARGKDNGRDREGAGDSCKGAAGSGKHSADEDKQLGDAGEAAGI